MNAGAGDLSPLALVAAAEAFARGRDTSTAVSDQEIKFAERVVVSAMPLLQADGNPARTGALAVAAVASASPTLRHHATALLFHPDPRVRARGIAQAPADQVTFAQLAKDASAVVRGALAARGAELSDDLRSLLADDPDVAVRQTLVAALTAD
jgi:hypothetical protein